MNSRRISAHIDRLATSSATPAGTALRTLTMAQAREIAGRHNRDERNRLWGADLAANLFEVLSLV
jgi:hypothetical protein